MAKNKSSKNYATSDTINRGEQLVRRWYNDTAGRVESQIQPRRRADMLCISALSVGMNYYTAAIELLRGGYHMPVKALVRILCELSAKLAWCLMVPRGKRKRSEAAVEKKINQWEKYSELKNLAILEEFRKFAAADQKAELETVIEQKRAIVSRLAGQMMPRTIEVFNRLPSSWRRGIYPRGYLQFNNAVHIDLTSLAERIKKDGSMFVIDSDSAESVEELAGYCASFIYSIIALVRLNFGFDSAQMAKEFAAINHNPEK
jgi:hypothetical protein